MATTLLYPETTDPVSIAAAKQTSRLLIPLGYAAVASIAPAQFSGRNGTWIMTLEDGAKVFVKRFSSQAASPRAFDRSMAFGRFAEEFTEYAPSSPRIVSGDRAHRILIFEHCPGTSLAHLIVDEQVPDSFSPQAGRLLAGLHTAPGHGLEPTSPSSPPVQMLSIGVPHTRYLDFTIAEMEFWGRLQADSKLVNAAADLRAWELEHQNAPVHGDLRLDQFHLNQGQLRLLDWEEFGLGDPARDLGMLAGEWLYRAVLDTVTTRGGAQAPPEAFDDDSATSRIADRIATVIPRIQDMWRAYAGHITPVDEQLPVRATAHMGWHLVDRSIARAATISRLPGIERAAAGIGRKALLDPGSYVQALGFGRTVQ